MMIPKRLRLFKNLAPYLKPDFFFINIGANDGVENDPIYPFLKKYGARGIQVEPIPYNATKLERNFRDCPGIIIENIAISPISQSPPQTIYHFPDFLIEESYIFSQISSLSRQHIQLSIDVIKNLPEISAILRRLPKAHWEDYIEASEIPCLSFDELIQKHRVQHIDFLNLDVEGLDFQIISSIDLAKYAPTVLCIETYHFSTAEHQQFSKLMKQHRYQRIQRFDQCSEVYARHPR